jgi:hypothetical protein
MLANLFPRNERDAERVVRIVVGVALLCLAFVGQTKWGLIGVVLLATRLAGTCHSTA